MNFASRIEGCLAGLALGDAMGMPSEFLTREQIQSNYGWIDTFQAPPVWHPHAVMKAGEVTDDTWQALAVAHAYQQGIPLAPSDVARELLAWEGRDGPSVTICMGPGTRQALENLHAGMDVQKSGQSGTTNGASMRVPAVGLVNYRSPENALKDACAASLPTHATGVSMAGAAAVACAISAACLENAKMDDVIKAAKWGAQEGFKKGIWTWATPLEDRIDLALKLVSETRNRDAALHALAHYVGTGMQVGESVAAVFGVLQLTDGDPMLAVTTAANLGGDTDTIASIVGAICGAWRGVETLDGTLKEIVEQVNDLDFSRESNLLEKFIN